MAPSSLFDVLLLKLPPDEGVAITSALQLNILSYQFLFFQYLRIIHFISFSLLLCQYGIFLL